MGAYETGRLSPWAAKRALAARLPSSDVASREAPLSFEERALQNRRSFDRV
jgi:hypothetical protein